MFRSSIRACMGAIVGALILAGPAAAADHTVAIKGFAFNPADLSVAAGDTVTFVNQDSASHTVTATDGGFDTGRLSKGESASVKIAAAGTLAYICSIHRSMKGRIVAK